jgi:hypothetical protein
VLEKVMQLHAEGAIVLMGNHDHMMVKSFEQDPVFIERYMLMWIRDEFHHGYNGEKTVVFGWHLRCLELPSRKVYSV